MSKFGQTLPPYPLEGVVEEALRGAPDVAPSGDDRGFYLDLAEPFVRLLAEKQADDGAIHDPYWEGGESPTGTARFGGGRRQCSSAPAGAPNYSSARPLRWTTAATPSNAAA